MSRSQDVAELERFLADRGERLMRIALALTGDRHEAEDLLQTALERLLRVRPTDVDRESYLRRTLYNLAADGWRRRGSWRRKLALLQAGSEQAPAGEAAVDARDALMRLLRKLPPRQRAVIVLRYWGDLSDAQVAALLGCSEGTVRSQAWRALAKLRVSTALAEGGSR